MFVLCFGIVKVFCVLLSIRLSMLVLFVCDFDSDRLMRLGVIRCDRLWLLSVMW